MKTIALLVGFLVGAVFCGPVACGQDAAPDAAVQKAKKKGGKKREKKEKKAKGEKPAKAELSAVGKALKDVKFVGGKKVDTQATHYIYLVSASWCGPCNAEMPKVVEQYKEMSKCGVELILVSGDHNPSQATGFMKKYGADFPCAMGDTERKKLPGWEDNRSIPFAIIVDAEGNKLTSGNAAPVINNWRQTTGK